MPRRRSYSPGRKPSRINQGATLRAQPNAEHLLVKDRGRLGFEESQTFRRQAETRMPLDPLSRATASQPVEDVFLVVGRKRGAGAKRGIRIAAEERRLVIDADQRSEQPQLRWR